MVYCKIILSIKRITQLLSYDWKQFDSSVMHCIRCNITYSYKLWKIINIQSFGRDLIYSYFPFELFMTSVLLSWSH